MKKKRLESKEVNEFKPSFYNPLEVECDDGKLESHYKNLKIISPVINNNEIVALNGDGDICTLDVHNLKHYPSQKQPKTIELFECLDVVCNTHYTAKEGYVFSLNTLTHSDRAYMKDCFKRKTGRSIIVDLETGEVLR